MLENLTDELKTHLNSVGLVRLDVIRRRIKKANDFVFHLSLDVIPVSLDRPLSDI